MKGETLTHSSTKRHVTVCLHNRYTIHIEPQLMQDSLNDDVRILHLRVTNFSLLVSLYTKPQLFTDQSCLVNQHQSMLNLVHFRY